MSKEEIEKAKERCNSIVEFCKNNKECQENKICSDCYIEIEDISAIKTLLQYIDQLEEYLERISKQLDNVALDQIPIGIAELQQKNESAYWKGYIQKQNEAMEICKMCKYRKQYFEKKVEEK